MASNRHLGRIVAMQTLYEHDFRGGDAAELELDPILQRNLDEFRSNIDDTNFVEDVVDGVHSHQQDIDNIIGPAAPEWPVDQIAKIDKIILRVGVYELMIKRDVPPKVAINEAVELAKTFGGENSSKFINGVLGTIYRNSEFYEPEEESSAKAREQGQKPENPKHIRATREYTAGGVVFRRVDDRIQILMIQDRLGRWTIPKGHVEEGESIEQTAVREVAEETGLTHLRLGEKLDKLHFFYRKEGKLIFMTTYVFLMEALGDTDNIIPEDSEGIVDAKWFDQDKALGLIEYRDTEKLFRLGLSKLRAADHNAGRANHQPT